MGVSTSQKNVVISDEEQDFEVMPLTPLRRIEKRLDAMETSKSSQNMEHFIDKVIDMVELNQKIVDEVVKANQGLREDIAVLIGKMTDNEAKLSEFVAILKEAGEAEVGTDDTEKIGKVLSPFAEKFADSTSKILEANNSVLDTLVSIDKNIRKLAPPAPATITSTILARRAAQAHIGQ